MDWRRGQLTGDGEALAVRLLGSFEVTIGGRPVAVTTGRLRTVLAVMAFSAGRPVSVDRLATALWSENLPNNARRSVQTYLTRLRNTVGASRITAAPAGYQLHVEPDQVDALRFTRLLDDAAVATDPAAERARLVEALGMWRGTPFDGVQSDWLERTQAPRLTERYLVAVERRIDLDLASGHHLHDLVANLHELTTRHPLRESLWVRLLLALDGSGRQAEALERYETIRVRLAEQLGADPGPELRQVHADLLAGRPAARAPVEQSVTPRQLPADIDAFTGRETALKTLDDLVCEDRHTGYAVVISAIAGTAGVGKTALALHWAHRVADRFPDGQLYVNLRGFHPSGQAMTPAEAIRGFLDALEVPPQRIPSDLDAQAGLYRSLLADKQMLILLDNARDTDQVLPLLPGSPGSLVVVTSRNQLTSLVATRAARPVVLDLLTVDEARALLVQRLGADRIAAEPAATDQIITSCARLPLALAVAAARAATRPNFPLHTLAIQLRHAHSDLDSFTDGDPATDVRAVFSWSYRTLTPAAARLFRLLALHPGPDLAEPAAASLAGLPEPDVCRLLAELTRAHLLTGHTPGRYVFHDLLRAYASELAQAHDDNDARRAAVHRLLDHYLHTAHAAAGLLNPPREPVTIEHLQPGVVPEELADPDHALAWCSAEHGVLLAAIGHAATAGFDAHVWQLAWAIMDFLHRRGRWHDWLTTQHAALAAARRLSDRRGQALAHRSISSAYSYLGQHAEAEPHRRQALELYGQLGDQVGQAHVHLSRSVLLARQRSYTEALHHCQQALDRYVTSGDQLGEARTLNTMGWCYAELGNCQQALDHCQRAAVLFHELEDRLGLGITWDSIGYAHRRLGHHREAIRWYQRALGLFEELDGPFFQADTLANLGDAHLALGEPDAARTAWRQALSLFGESADRQADEVRDKLARLDR